MPSYGKLSFKHLCSIPELTFAMLLNPSTTLLLFSCLLKVLRPFTVIFPFLIFSSQGGIFPQYHKFEMCVCHQLSYICC